MDLFAYDLALKAGCLERRDLFSSEKMVTWLNSLQLTRSELGEQKRYLEKNHLYTLLCSLDQGHRVALANLVRLQLQSQGSDSILYRNKVESTNTWSSIVFDPSHITITDETPI